MKVIPIREDTCMRCAKLYRVGGCLDHRLQRGDVSFSVNADNLYSFVEDRLSPTPIQIHSKRQYKRLLKEKGYTDQVDSKQKLVDIRKRPFDAKWDAAINTAIKQSIAEVKKKPYNALGKLKTQADVHKVLKRDYQRQQTRRVAHG